MKEYDADTLKKLLEQGILSQEEYDSITNKDIILFNKENVKMFKDSFKNQNKNTAEAYYTSLKKIVEIISEDSFEDAISKNVSSNVEEVKKAIRSLSAEGYTYDSVRRYKSALAYYHELFAIGESGIRDMNISDLKDKKADMVFFTEDEIDHIAQVGDTRGQLMITMFFELGLRRQELIGIKKGHIDRANRQLFIYDSDGKLDRKVFFSETCMRLIEKHEREWEDEVDEMNDKRMQRSAREGKKYDPIIMSDYLFQTFRSDNISYSTIYKTLKDCAFAYYYRKHINEDIPKVEVIEIAEDRSKDFHTESIRSSKIISLLSRDYSVEKIQVIMGVQNSWEVKKFLKYAKELYPDRFR